jgi:RNA polymerase sigma factor (sigma-70 family)
VVSMGDRWVEAEFEAIFRQHYGRILRVIRRVLQRDSEAEEVGAEVFLRLYRCGPGVAAGGQVGGWLYRTATRASIDALRANRRRGVEELEDDIEIEGEDLAEGPLTLLLRQERIGEVRDALAELKVKKAQLLLLRHSGLTYQEIAQAMRVDVHSVGTKLARAEAEFSALYERRQRRNRKTRQLQTAGVTMAASTSFSSLTSGAVSLGLYGLAFVGGWIEQFGSLRHVQACVDLGILSSLIMPSDALWRRAAFKFQPPLLGAAGVSPFTGTLIPSHAMVVYAVLYAVLAILLAQFLFARRDL